MTPDDIVTVVVPRECAGERLDQFLAGATGLTRSQIGQRIAAGDVLVGEARPAKAGARLRGQETIRVAIPRPPPSEAIPQDIPLVIVYEDEHLVVVDKAADMVVHPAPGHPDGTLVNALVHRYGVLAEGPAEEDGYPRPGIVHRLDRGTSGLLVVARTALARESLSAQIAERTARRHYLALVHGPRIDDAGTFDTLHGRHPADRKRYTTRVREGRRAVTHWVVIARARTVALVECLLTTGRTHQIRVQFADAGHPVAGDDVYGGRRRAPGPEGAALARLDRQALHAWRLAFVHPETLEPMELRSMPPDDLARVITTVFGAGTLEALARSPTGP